MTGLIARRKKTIAKNSPQQDGEIENGFLKFLAGALVCFGFSFGLGYFYLRDLRIYTKSDYNVQAYFYDKSCRANTKQSNSVLRLKYNGKTYEIIVSEKVCNYFETGRLHTVYHIDKYSDVFLLEKPKAKKGYGALFLFAFGLLFSVMSYAHYKGQKKDNKIPHPKKQKGRYA